MKKEQLSISLPVFGTQYDSVPFSQFSTIDFKEVIEKAIETSLKEVTLIANNYKPATFENTIKALTYSRLRVDRLTSILFNLNSAESTDRLQQQAQAVSPLLSDYTSNIRLNALLFKRIKLVYKQREQLGLSGEQLTLVEKTYKDFVRNGALLRNRKNRLREIDKELAFLKLKFSENLLSENQLYMEHITDPSEVTG